MSYVEFGKVAKHHDYITLKSFYEYLTLKFRYH